MTATLTPKHVVAGHRARGALARTFLGAVGDPVWARPALWGVLGLAAVLYTWALGAGGYANAYYSAAVLSGTRSWHAFFFGALDAGSFITVDKPPFALWVMGLSARIFGFGTWSLLLPQAVAGVATVGLVHSAVRRSLAPRRAAHAAALIAALVMALTPITVAINRDNNPDTILALLLVLAAWFCLEAIRTGRLRTIVISAVLVGFAFNTKMLQAYLVVPAFALVYLYAAPGTLVRRFGRLLVAGVALVVSSAWWMVVVDLWPAASRPYIGGSTDNTVWDLVVGYNGLGRIFGGGGGRGGGASFGGEAGIGRLFNEVMAGQISWLLPFAGIALIAGLWLAFRRPAVRAALLLWGGWLVVHFAVFSLSSGTFHPYYTTAMAPAVAALTGIGVVLLWRAPRGWAWVLPVGVAVTGGWAVVVLRRTPDFVPWLWWAVAAATVVAVLALAARAFGARRVAAVSIVATLVAGLAAPAAFAVTPLSSAVNGTNPTAGPATRGGMGMPGGGGFPGMRGEPGELGGSGHLGGMPPEGGDIGFGRGPGGGRDQVTSEMADYLVRNQGGATWLVAVSSAQSASSLILSTGRPVIAMGGFTGSDPAMTVEKLASYVASGQLRYIMVGDGDRGGSSEITAWVREHGTLVDASEYGGTTENTTLYELAATDVVTT
ncbi:glycosyltransferase family 39 protein [Acrocarpospora catenulata]|uniref:glycosyltransferase family 39 protein n=1 Tax=Acrocarpospora catenulata TaxID=2836182 RepID=UPI001BDB0433|nr:glycosyltransferase family 39 protein [Acrocarpospora catenulata]